MAIIAIALTIPFCFQSARAFDCLARASDRIKSGDEEAAIAAVKRGAREGDARCKFILGMWSLSGAKMEPDPEVGIRWLSEAAKNGLPAAQSALGLLYASGLMVEKDDEAAARWYRKAANYGDPLGQTALGFATMLGVGVPKNPTEAYQWTSLAAAQGDERALAQLPAMESALTADQLEQAKRNVSEFRPQKIPASRRLSKKDLLRVVGLNRPPGEIERFFGFGGVDR